VLGVDEGGGAAELLHFGDDLQGERGLAGGFGAVDLDDPAAGRPPTPRAMSSPSEPVETVWMSLSTSPSPRRMIEPLPNCFSIWESAAARALALLSSMGLILAERFLVIMAQSLRAGGRACAAV
jgi:hypothetical protein